MNIKYHVGLSAALLVAGCFAGWAQDTVTIPKSRLEELERKEAELEKLKGKGAEGNRVPKGDVPPQIESPVAGQASGAPAVRREVPLLQALPPFQEGQTVQAGDLDAYYRQDPAAANRRFQNLKMVVRGEVVGFELPTFRRNYRVLLQGNDRLTRVSCDFVPPENYKAVFSVESGSRLVGLQGETKIPIVKVGDMVLVSGVCKGLRSGAVFVQGRNLEMAR